MKAEKTRSHFITFNQVQDRGGSKWTTTVIVNYFFAALRPHSFGAGPRFHTLFF